MQYEVYRDLHIYAMCSVVEFFSIGQKGVILKRIAFTPTEYADIYGICFGDVDIGNETDEFVTSNNGDRNKVLATVAYAINIYLNNYPDRYIYVTGNKEEKTRLYRMAITLNFNSLSTQWSIYGETNEGFIPFIPNTPVKGFLIKRNNKLQYE